MDSDSSLAEALGLESGASVLTLSHVYVLAAILLTIISQMWTGFNTCLTSLDVDQLQVLVDTAGKDAASEQLARYAQRILPLRRRGRLLLCTLLIMAVFVRALLALVLHEALGPLRGWIVASATLFFLSELVPEAFCAWMGPRVGAAAVPLVWVMLGVLYPITKPMALALDFVFPQGDHVLNRAQLRAFCESATVPGMLAKGQAEMMIGALGVAQATVGAVMVPMEKVFTLGFDQPLDAELLLTVVRRGFTRVPVVNPRTQQVEGILHCKELLAQRFRHGSGRPRTSEKCEGFGGGARGEAQPETAGDFLVSLRKEGKEPRVYVCGKNTRLCTLLYEFKTSSHIAVVADVDEPGAAVIDSRTGLSVKHIGIVTLHNMFEVILQMSEGFHESLGKSDSATTMQLVHAPSLETFVSDRGFLGPAHAEAVAAFLQSTELSFHPRHVKLGVLRKFLQTLPVLRLRVDTYLYKRNREATFSVLILQGEAAVSCGEDGVESVAGSWRFLGAGALRQMLAVHTGYRVYGGDSPIRRFSGSSDEGEPVEEEHPVYTPDFTAKVLSPGFLVLRIDKLPFLDILRCPSEVGDGGRRVSLHSSLSAFSAQSSGCQDEVHSSAAASDPGEVHEPAVPYCVPVDAGAAPKSPPASPCPPLLTAQTAEGG